MKLNRLDLEAIEDARKEHVRSLCRTMNEHVYSGESHSQRRWDTWKALKTALERLDEIDAVAVSAMLDGTDIDGEIAK